MDDTQASRAIAKRIATVVRLRPIDDVVAAIHLKFDEAIQSDNKAHRARLAAGTMLLSLRKRIEEGEAGEGLEWWPWYASKFVRSRKDAERLMRIASAEDPEAALLEEREKTRLAVAKHRDKKAAELTVSSKPAKPAKRRSKEEIAADLHAHQMAWAEAVGGAVPIEVARHVYLIAAEERVVDFDSEREITDDALRAIDRKLNGGKSQSPVSARPQDGRSEDSPL